MEMTTRMELRPVSELIPYARNAREHSEVQIRQLRSSLREFGFVAPMLIDAQGNILAGHGRLAAAAAEGLERVPCVLVEHLTATQRRAYILADNRLAEQASWDAELVSLELQELRDAGFELDLTGFDASDILLEDPPEAGEDGYDLNRVLSSAKDLKETVGMSDILAMTEMRLLITDRKEPVTLSGKAAYISDNVTMDKKLKTAFFEEESGELAYILFK